MGVIIPHSPSLPAILQEYGELHWSITVGKKPRGLWRPLVTIKFWNTVNKNKLNIDGTIKAPLFRLPSWKKNSCDKSDKVEKAPECPFEFFTSSNPRVNERIYLCCRRNHAIGGWSVYIFEECWEEKFYLPWRPSKPDYSDIIQWIRENICEPVVEEYHCRLLEAYQSEPIEEEIVVSSESVKVERVKEELKKKPARKVKLV